MVHFVVASDVQSTLSKPKEAFKRTLQSCSAPSINLRTVPIGFKCQTSKGSIYRRVARDHFGEAWKGPDGLIWSDRLGGHTQYDAIKICENLSAALPDKTDFERGETNGFREVLSQMKDRWYCGTTAPGQSVYAYDFSGNAGNVGQDIRSFYNFSVRCVSR